MTDPETAKEDWFIRTLNRRIPLEMYGLKAMYDGWRSDMSKFVVALKAEKNDSSMT